MAPLNGDPHDEEVAIFDEEAAFEDGLDFLSEIDHRASLEGKSRIAAHITLDLQDKGPLYLYVKQRRIEAIQSMKKLVECDPSDVAAISTAQAAVREYRKSVDFIYGGLREGEYVERLIKEEYGDDAESKDGDGDLLQEPEPSWRRRR